MDISFKVDSQKFNYRVCAMMISDNKILAMHDERSPCFYLPGGRVKMGETAEQAVTREVQEELGVAPDIIRLLYLSRAFFTEDVVKMDYHELCIYATYVIITKKRKFFLFPIVDTSLNEKASKIP